MPYPQLDRSRLNIRPLAERENRVEVEKHFVSPQAEPEGLSTAAKETVLEAVARIKKARDLGAPVVLAFGAHTIKNGLAPVIQALMRGGWVQHLATNGAGVIHDWEFAYQGKSSEDVKLNVARGSFGIWEETGRYINLAILVGAYNGLGYGESVGRFILEEELLIPEPGELIEALAEAGESPAAVERAAAAADLLKVLQTCNIAPGGHKVRHPWKQYSLQAAAAEQSVPFTSHPMFGHDIIYTHPLNHGGAIGRTAERDFLSFAETVSNLENGVYLSVGSAVMSPMIFEKSFSMAQNLAMQNGTAIRDHSIFVVDLAENSWDWSQGEPPPDSAAYYLRYCKTFSRMGGTMHYATADNRDFLLALLHELT
ncbi:MAG: hypothetical protein R6V56_01995 [Lentisphaeria bacterium]